MANLALQGYFLAGIPLLHFHRPRNTGALKSRWLLANENSVGLRLEIKWEKKKRKLTVFFFLVCFLGAGRANDSGSALGQYVSAEKA